jgi:SAM-dependent methyltransferase
MRCNAAWTWHDGRPVAIRSACDLACGSGRHLIACALQHPDIFFVGVDGTTEHVRVAQQYAESLSLINVRFECADLNEWQCDSEAFDLITCSGTFSWVPIATQAAILSIIDKGLSRHGAAVIRILTQPASNHLIEAQKVIQSEVSREATLDQRRTNARGYARELSPSLDKKDSTQDALINRTLSAFIADDGSALPHELLGASITAFFLREFENMLKYSRRRIASDNKPNLVAHWHNSGHVSPHVCMARAAGDTRHVWRKCGIAPRSDQKE